METPRSPEDQLPETKENLWKSLKKLILRVREQASREQLYDLLITFEEGNFTEAELYRKVAARYRDFYMTETEIKRRIRLMVKLGYAAEKIENGTKRYEITPQGELWRGQNRKRMHVTDHKNRFKRGELSPQELAFLNLFIEHPRLTMEDLKAAWPMHHVREPDNLNYMIEIFMLAGIIRPESEEVFILDPKGPGRWIHNHHELKKK